MGAWWRLSPELYNAAHGLLIEKVCNFTSPTSLFFTQIPHFFFQRNFNFELINFGGHDIII